MADIPADVKKVFKNTRAEFTGEALKLQQEGYCLNTDNPEKGVEQVVRKPDGSYHFFEIGDGAFAVSTETENFTAEDNTIHLVETSLNEVACTIPNAEDENFQTRVYKVTGIDTPDIVCTTPSGQLIGGSTEQSIQGASEGFHLVSHTDHYEIVQDNRGAVARKLSQSTTVISGYAISINESDGTLIDVASGVFSKEYAGDAPVSPATSDISAPTSKLVKTDAITGVTLTGLATDGFTVLQIDVDGNIIQTLNDVPTQESENESPKIAVIVHSGGAILSAESWWTVGQNPSKRLSWLMGKLGILKEGVTVFGATAGSLQFAHDAGTISYAGADGDKYPNNPDEQAVDSADPVAGFILAKQDAFISFTQTVIDPTQYDVDGTLTTISGNDKVSIQRIMINLNGTFTVQYGQNVYATIQDGLTALAEGTDTFTKLSAITKVSRICAYLVVDKDCTDLTDTSTALFVQTGLLESSTGISSASELVDIAKALLNGNDADGQIIKNIGDPVDDNDTVNKKYVDSRGLQEVTDVNPITTHSIFINEAGGGELPKFRATSFTDTYCAELGVDPQLPYLRMGDPAGTDPALFGTISYSIGLQKFLIGDIPGVGSQDIVMSYNTGVTFDSENDIPNKKYVDSRGLQEVTDVNSVTTNDVTVGKLTLDVAGAGGDRNSITGVAGSGMTYSGDGLLPHYWQYDNGTVAEQLLSLDVNGKLTYSKVVSGDTLEDDVLTPKWYVDEAAWKLESERTMGTTGYVSLGESVVEDSSTYGIWTQGHFKIVAESWLGISNATFEVRVSGGTGGYTIEELSTPHYGGNSMSEGTVVFQSDGNFAIGVFLTIAEGVNFSVYSKDTTNYTHSDIDLSEWTAYATCVRGRRLLEGVQLEGLEKVTADSIVTTQTAEENLAVGDQGLLSVGGASSWTTLTLSDVFTFRSGVTDTGGSRVEYSPALKRVRLTITYTLSSTTTEVGTIKAGYVASSSRYGYTGVNLSDGSIEPLYLKLGVDVNSVSKDMPAGNYRTTIEYSIG